MEDQDYDAELRVVNPASPPEQTPSGLPPADEEPELRASAYMVMAMIKDGCNTG